MYCYKARSYWLGSYHITQVSTSIFLACTAITVLFNWPEISFKLFLIQFQLSFTNQCHAKSLFEFSIKNWNNYFMTADEFFFFCHDLTWQFLARKNRYQICYEPLYALEKHSQTCRCQVQHKRPNQQQNQHPLNSAACLQATNRYIYSQFGRNHLCIRLHWGRKENDYSFLWMLNFVWIFTFLERILNVCDMLYLSPPTA